MHGLAGISSGKSRFSTAGVCGGSALSDSCHQDSSYKDRRVLVARVAQCASATNASCRESAFSTRDSSQAMHPGMSVVSEAVECADRVVRPQCEVSQLQGSLHG